MEKKLLLVLVLFISFFRCYSEGVSLDPDKKTNKNIRLTLKEAVKMAIKNRPSLKAFQYATQASRETERKALAGYKPQVSFTESPFFSKGAKGLQNSANLQASQLIYSFAGPIEEYKIAQTGTEISEYQTLSNKALIKFEVTRSFLESWLLQRKNKFIEYLKKSSIETVNKSEHQNELNLLNKNTWLNDAATYSENMSTVYIYPDELSNAKNQLEYFIGKKFENDGTSLTLAWNSNQEIKLESLDYYYDFAIKHRNDIHEKELEIEQQQQYQNYYKKTYLPSLSLSGETGRTSGAVNSSIGAVLSWNMFDGGANYYESQKANAQKLKISMEKDQLILTAKFQVQRAYYELNTIFKQLVAQDIRLAQAKNELVLKKQKLEIGDISPVDFETARYSWETQKFNWLNIRVNAAIVYNRLHYVTGYYAYRVKKIHKSKHPNGPT